MKFSLFLSLSSVEEEHKCLICNNYYLGNRNLYRERQLFFSIPTSIAQIIIIE